MNRNVIISCAVTGSGNSVGKHPDIPVTPKEIATAAIEAARAGAAIAHIHVRDPDSGKPSRRVDLYREVVERIRESETDVVINLTTGMGGDLFLGPDENQFLLQLFCFFICQFLDFWFTHLFPHLRSHSR